MVTAKKSISKFKVALQIQICDFFNFSGRNLSTQSGGTNLRGGTVLAMVRNVPVRFFVSVGNGSKVNL